ncbi:transcription antitermination factor NusB [Actinomyces culturomici]|uniref:transcription antitermination factor NusB n=1 Tax=Actinomyces culturomici TaxID=1926276 RepID=UPI000E209F64|nr:transcription antitermination factor NusB [Actinomyces culturomici]
MSKAHRFTSRTKARKRAADVVFEADQRGMGRNPEVLRDILRQRRVITAAETPLPEYSIRIVEGVADNLRRIDDLISARAKVAGLDRIAAVDLAVMRVAVWEMLENSEDVPPIIAIDEAIAIVKSLSTDAAPNFVNGVLDAIRRALEAPAWSRRSSIDEAGAQAPKDEDEDLPVDADADDLDEDEAPKDVEEADDESEAETTADSRKDSEELSAEELEELDELLGEY